MSVNNDDDFGDHDGDGQWPFHNFVEQLLLDMFDSSKNFHITLNVGYTDSNFCFPEFPCLFLTFLKYQIGKFVMVV